MRLSLARRVLVTGASIAGNAVAGLLGRQGFDITVVERAPAFRDGGQNVDVRGVGREVLRRMGLEQAALERGTGEEGTAWVDRHGRVAAQAITKELGQDGPTAEMEILRGDLARLLYELACRQANFRFSDSVERVEQNADTVVITFASGMTERYDALVVAEGVGSSTRDLVFPGENAPRWMNLAIAYFTIPQTTTDNRMWRWYNAPGGRSVSLRPDRHGTTRAMLMLHQPPGGEQVWDATRQKAYLRERFADAGWETPRILAAMTDTDDFYFEVLRQVRMPCLSRGRVVLTGDAAWCATPIGGIGTTLAVTGAYVLAGELAQSKDMKGAFEAYERAMRPMAEQVHRIPGIVPRLMHPHSRAGIWFLHRVLRMMNTPVVQTLTTKLFDPSPVQPDLSGYANGAALPLT